MGAVSNIQADKRMLEVQHQVDESISARYGSLYNV
jgi:hypothetical protein